MPLLGRERGSTNAASILGATLALAIALGAACDQLGNPPRRQGRSPAAAWSNGIVRIVTTSISVPADGLEQLLGSVPPGTLEHVDRIARRDGVFTLVEATLEAATFPLAPSLVLTTDLRARNGVLVRRRWVVPGEPGVYRAVFAMPAPATEVATGIL